MSQSSVVHKTIGSRAIARPSSVDFRRTKAFIFVSLGTRQSKDDLWQVDGGVSLFPFFLSAVAAIAASSNE